MSELGTKHKKLLKELEEVRSKYETLLEDSSVKSLPKEFERTNDEFDGIIQAVEDGDYVDEPEEEEDDV